MTWLWEAWDWLRYRAADLHDFSRERRSQLKRLIFPMAFAVLLLWWFSDPPTYVGPAPDDAHKVVILLHGHGASGSNISGLAERIHKQLPGVCFIMPDAPHRSGLGRTWYPSFTVPTKAEVKIRQDEHRAQARAVVMTIISELRSDDIPLQNIYLAGFSQGATLSADVFASEPQADGIGGIISLSGGALDINLDSLESRTPTRLLVTHGTRDRVLGSGRSKTFATKAQEGGHEVTYFEFDDGHTVPAEVLDEIVRFLG